MKKLMHSFLTIFLTTTITRLVTADPRTKAVQLMCKSDPTHNKTAGSPNFAATMDKASQQLQAQRYGVAETGLIPNASFGMAQCYGDLTPVECVTCYSAARARLPLCKNKNKARVYLDGCYLRADNYSFFEEYEGPEDKTVCESSKTGTEFQVATKGIMGAVKGALENEGYGRWEENGIYVLANCWKTLSVGSCKACLYKAFYSIVRCLPKSEGRVMNTGCFLRYSNLDFLNANPNPNPNKESSKGVKVLVGIASVSSVVALAFVVAIAMYVRKCKLIRKKRRANSNDVKKLVKLLNNNGLSFKFSTLEKATGSFSESNKLGQGGFGIVYKGILADGREIAVKRLFLNTTQTASNFYNEVRIISSLEHKNLVRLLGYSCSGPETLLVYEFMPNQSVHHFIFDLHRGRLLNWEKRSKIILGIAEGLTYLHENETMKIIHRDIKASNILLDSKFRAKIADFGLARSFQEDETHVSTTVVGTLGYMAPEYVAHGHLTEMTDVYSFGVLVLEIITGKHTYTQISQTSHSLVLSAWNLFQHGSLDELIDPNLNFHKISKKSKNEVSRAMHVGLLCTQEASCMRPTMSNVLNTLLQTFGKDNLIQTNPSIIVELKTPVLSDAASSPLTWNSNGTNSDAPSLSPSNAIVSNNAFYPRYVCL